MNHSMNHHQRERGQTLIEVIIAIGLVVLVLITLVSALTLAIRNNQFARDQVLARNRTRESLEWVRSVREQMGWDAFYTMISNDGSPAVYCLTALPTDIASITSLPNQPCSSTEVVSGTKYIRTMTMTLTSAEEIEIVVTVTWTEGGKDHQSMSTLIVRKWL